MARSDTGTSTITDITRQLNQIMSAGTALGPQAEQFWKAQDAILDETEAFAKHWFQRRHQATRTALDAARRMASDGQTNPEIAMQVMTDWQKHSMERVAEDFREWHSLCSSCAGHFTQAEMPPAEDAVKKGPKK